MLPPSTSNSESLSDHIGLRKRIHSTRTGGEMITEGIPTEYELLKPLSMETPGETLRRDTERASQKCETVLHPFAAQAWINFIGILPCLACLDDACFSRVRSTRTRAERPATRARSGWRTWHRRAMHAGLVFFLGCKSASSGVRTSCLPMGEREVRPWRSWREMIASVPNLRPRLSRSSLRRRPGSISMTTFSSPTPTGSSGLSTSTAWSCRRVGART